MGKTKKKFVKMKCSPNSTKTLNNNLEKFTCYNNERLLALRDKWNIENQTRQIISNNSKTIWKKLKEYMTDKCNNERCWLDQSFINKYVNDKSHDNIFSPIMPPSWLSNSNEWLSNFDILKVMRQYETAYPHFKFFGPSPIDFDERLEFNKCVNDDICNLNIDNLKDKYKQIGISLNLDTHDKGGSHWVSLFIDLEKKYIFYFDSNGDKIPKRVKILINRVNEQCKRIYNKKFDVYNNTLQHQYTDGTCGIYSLYFFISLITNSKKFNYFIKNRIPDKIMKKYRFIYFNY